MKKISSLCLGGILFFGAVPSLGVDTSARDNSAVNKRDRAVTELTADQQKMNGSDSEITRLIRRAVVKDDTLSTYAHNVKIITVNGRVTLKGPVQSEQERGKIFNEAVRVAGNGTVSNHLEVKQK